MSDSRKTEAPTEAAALTMMARTTTTRRRTLPRAIMENRRFAVPLGACACGAPIFAFILLKLGIFLASLLLRCKDFLIDLAGFEQFLVRAVRADVTVVQHQNMVGILYRRDTLGDDELGRVRDFLAECLTDER